MKTGAVEVCDATDQVYHSEWNIIRPGNESRLRNLALVTDDHSRTINAHLSVFVLFPRGRVSASLLEIF